VDHGRRLDVGLRVSQAPSTTASTNNLQRQHHQQQQQQRRRRRRRPPVTTDVLIAASRTRRTARIRPALSWALSDAVSGSAVDQ